MTTQSEAVEAAAKVLAAQEFGVTAWEFSESNREHYRQRAIGILEAAAKARGERSEFINATTMTIEVGMRLIDGLSKTITLAPGEVLVVRRGT